MEQIKRLNRVAAQKAEADIRDALKEAVSLIKTDPSAAKLPSFRKTVPGHHETCIPV